jgi:Condensation domain
MTYRQEWIVEASRSGWSNHAVAVAMRVGAAGDREHLQGALDDLVLRHGALRTVAVRTSRGPMQQVVEGVRLIVPSTGSRTVEEEVHEPFDLYGGPLVRVGWCRLADGGDGLVIVAHHAICDGSSAEIVARDLLELYASRTEARPARLPELEEELAAYAEWERAFRDAASVGWWRRQLDGASPRLGTCRERYADALPARVCLFPLDGLPQGAGTRLQAVAKDLRTTPSRVAGAVVMASLRAHMAERASVGWISSNRDRPAIRDAIGEFEDTLPVVLDLSGDITFDELVMRFDDAVADAYDRQVPSGLLEDACRGGGDGPLWDVRINVLAERRERRTGRSESVDGALTRVKLRRERLSYMFDRWWRVLGLLSYDLEIGRDGTLGGYLVANVNGVSPCAVEDLLGRFARAMHRICEEPRVALRALA